MGFALPEGRQFGVIRKPFSTSSRGPETGLGDINVDLIEADFWPGMTSELPVTRPES
jgi:hypothetical protein